MGRRWLAAIAMPFVLAGCASGELTGTPSSATSIVIDSFSAVDAGVEPPPEGATNVVLDGTTKPARLTVTSWGSSGCVPVPQSVQWADRFTIEVSTARSANRECAANYEPISQVVELPDGHEVGEVTAVEVDGKQVQFTLEGEQ